MNFLNNKYKYLILILIVIASAVALLQLKLKVSSDWLAIAGLLFALWQIAISINTSQEGREDKLRDAIDKLEEDSSKRDFYHEQMLAQIQRELGMLTSQFEHHQTTHGHPGLTEEVLRMKDEICKMSGALAALTRSSEMARRLEKLEDQFGALKKN